MKTPRWRRNLRQKLYSGGSRSRVTWKRGSDRVALTQKTTYPHTPSTQIEVATDKQDKFPIYVRIPAWAGPKTTIAINGKRTGDAPEAGKFARIEQTWKDGDRIEIEFDMPTRLEPVDPQHPNLMATVHGPLALFAVGEIPATVRKQDLLTATQSAPGSTDWHAKTATGALTLRPFTAIKDEHYRLYLNVNA